VYFSIISENIHTHLSERFLFYFKPSHPLLEIPFYLHTLPLLPPSQNLQLRSVGLVQIFPGTTHLPLGLPYPCIPWVYCPPYPSKQQQSIFMCNNILILFPLVFCANSLLSNRNPAMYTPNHALPQGSLSPQGSPNRKLMLGLSA